MKIRSNFTAILSVLLINFNILTSDSDKYVSIIVPGQNGSCGRSFAKTPIVNTAMTRIASTPCDNIDFGQKNCISHLNEAISTMQTLHPKSKAILYGTSQGTATIVRRLAELSHEEQERQFAGVVLQSVLGSPESAILHTAGSMAGPVTYLPFARTWLPFAVRHTVFRAYNPRLPNAIESIKKVSPNIPVIIMHNDRDFQLSINDARRAYFSLINSGHKNAYLMEVHGTEPYHFDVLDCDPEKDKKISALQEVYKKHGLPHQEDLLSGEFDLSEYQPSAESILDIFKREDAKQERVRNSIDLASAVATSSIIGLKILSHLAP